MSQVVSNRLEVGDLVRVIAPDSLLHGLEGQIAQTDFGAGADPYKFESACGEHRGWLSAYQLRKLTATSVEGEPCVAGKALLLRSNWNAEKGCFEEAIVQPPVDHIADANKMVPPAIPAGWRELFYGEALSKTNLYESNGKWNPYTDFDPAGSHFPKYTKGLHYRHIRKIEAANPSETPNSSLPDPLNCIGNICDLAESTGVTCPVDSCDLDTGCRQAPADHIPNATKMLNSPEVPNSLDSNPPETPDISTAKRPVVYIAGPMRGIPHFNFPAFDAAKAYLIGKGYDVLSPADFDRVLDDFDPYKPEYETAEGCADFPKTMDFKRVVTRDLTAVTQCDAVALLPGWEKSKGAVAEIAVANWIGKPLIHLYGVDHTQSKAAFYVTQELTPTLKQFALWLAYDNVDSVKEAIDSPPREQHPDCDILEVAASITRGDRQAVYGPPDQDFKKTADMWTGMFQYMLAPGAMFEPRHVAMAMICIKLSREFHQKKRDNWIDIAGYARCGSLCSS